MKKRPMPMNCLLILFFLVSCETNPKHSSKPIAVSTFFSVKINGVLWHTANPESYHISYKPLSRQLVIAAESADGSGIEVSFHAIDKIVSGSYPSTANDNGVKSGIFYYPEPGSTQQKMGSVSFEVPVQENTVRIKKITRIGEDTYLIEGEFAALMYPLNSGKSDPVSRFSQGRFRLLYDTGDDGLPFTDYF